MRRSILIFLGLLACACVNAQEWDGTARIWADGKGTETEPYLIETAENLAYLAESVTAGETYEGVFFRLVNNLNMCKEKHLFAPIGFFDEYADSENKGRMIDNSRYFLGVFDGNGKTIDNVHVYFVDTENAVGGTGLFACISKNAVIKNLTIGKNSVIEGTNATGAVVGAMTGGRVENCVNMSALNISQDLGQGGIVGTMYGGVVSGCVNDADITGSTNVGGIAGYVDNGALIENCYNCGFVKFTGFYAGGLVGFLYEGTLRNCYSCGKTLNDFTGAAVVGTTDKDAVIENCYYRATEDYAVDNNVGVVKKLACEMRTDDFLALLDNGQNVWKKDINNVNNGFPLLGWQDSGTVSVDAISHTDKINIIVDGHNVSASVDGAYEIVVTDILGNIIAVKTINGGSLYIEENGVYIVMVSAFGHSASCKVIIR